MLKVLNVTTTKIIKMHMEPINVSVHTTDPKLRVFMLKNPKAARINEQMKKLADGGIHMNCQIVLVRDINDGENLIKTVRDLSNLYPYVTSVSAVPMAARVSQKVGAEADPTNFLLMHAMGPNVAGVIGTAVAAGTFMAIFGVK